MFRLIGTILFFFFDAPAGLTLQQREALASEAEDRRGYAVDATLENSVRKMEDGRPSQSVTALLSHGLANDAFHQLLAVHFEDPSTDSLSAREQRQYDVLRHRELPQPFSDRLLTAITERVATLPRGVGAGPSGHRYEHIRAVAATSTGSAILPQLLLLLANSMEAGIGRCLRLGWQLCSKQQRGTRFVQ